MIGNAPTPRLVLGLRPSLTPGTFVCTVYSSVDLRQLPGSQGAQDQASGRVDPTDQFLLWLV